MSDTEISGKEVSAFMADFWKLLKDYYQIKPDNPYWHNLTKAAAELGKKHRVTASPEGNQLLFYNLIMAFMDTQEGKPYTDNRKREQDLWGR